MPPDHPAPSDDAREVTRLLQRWSDGDRQALESLMPLVYDELRRLAGGYLRHERADHTLQATAWYTRPTSGWPARSE